MPTKVHLVKGVVFPAVMYGCESWIIKKAVKRKVTQLCPTLCDPIDCSTPCFPVHHYSRSLLKRMSSESVIPFNHLILCCPLLLLPSISSRIRVFSNESALHIRWPTYWSFSFNISPSNEYFFRIDWFDLLAGQGTIESSSALSLLYDPTLISIHDYCKNHSFGYMDLCWQSDVSAF